MFFVVPEILRTISNQLAVTNPQKKTEEVNAIKAAATAVSTDAAIGIHFDRVWEFFSMDCAKAVSIDAPTGIRLDRVAGF